jgi:hypothetical protein
VTASARAPSDSVRRVAISSAALLVNVTAQIRSASMPSVPMRCPIRSIRQNVFPAPGPATTSTGPKGASMAARWAGVGVGMGMSNIQYRTPNVEGGCRVKGEE